MKGFVIMAAAAVISGCQPVVNRLTGTAPASQITLPAHALAGPVMRVQIPARGANAALSRVAVNQDVETWLAVDNISLSFRQGVLVATRGLGFDLMGADVRNSLAAISGTGDDVYRRQMRYLTGDHQSTYLTAGCSMIVAGQETVGGQGLKRLEERCKARQHEFTNIFWLDGSGRIVRSRQWVSPEIGHLLSEMAAR